jgi:hypothetical protein
MSSTHQLFILLSAVCALDACQITEADPALETTEQASTTTTPFISEENGQADNSGAFCPDGQVAIGYQCTGSYCDNIRLICDTFPGTLGAFQPWSPWFSEETPAQGCIGADEWIVGIQCDGSWCDNMRFRCRKATIGGVRTAEPRTCAGPWSISEENPPLSLEGTGLFLRAMGCAGSYCDNVYSWGCQPEPRCDSSLGCGYSPSAPCQCDSACSFYGDCCPHKAEDCGP